MKKPVALLLSGLFLMPFTIPEASAQHLELGTMMGVSNYFGDLAPTPVMKETHPAYGVFARVNLSSSFAFTGAITSATISGNDENFDYNKKRNLNFRTPMLEYGAWLEFNFMKFGVDVTDKDFTPYVFIGAAFTQFEPEGENPLIEGEMIQLRNIRTEDVQYGSYAVSIPFGMGFKWQFHRHFATDFHFGFRRSYSDYLDDVSTVYPDDFANLQKRKGALNAQMTDPSGVYNGGIPLSSKGYRRGNADYTDWYMISTISISYRFYKHVKCRRFY